MSLTIRHPIRGEPVLPPVSLPTGPTQAEPSNLFVGAGAWALRLFNGSGRPERESRSLFHAWAESDLAHRDVAQQLWRTGSRR